MKWMKRILAIAGLTAGLVLLPLTFRELPAQAGEAQPTIRVGYPLQKGLTQKDTAGRRSGYSYDYLMEIAKYTGWDYEFVEVSGTLDEQLETLLAMLAEGEIDLMGGMIYTDSLARIYDYPGASYGTSYYALCAPDFNTEITSSNYYLLPVLRVAVYSSTEKRSETLDQFAQMSGITVEQVFCDSEEEMLRLLEEGKADVLLSSDVSLPTDRLNIVARFSPKPFYFATTGGNKSIVTGLDKALTSIERINPYFSINLAGKYFATQSPNLYFSEEEKAYIEKTGTLKAVALGGKPPVQYIDSVTGEYQGVSVDVLDYISDKTGLTFDLIMTESFAEYESIIKNGEADVALGVADELLQYDWQHMMTTMPYLEAPISLVLTDRLNPEEIEGKHLALSRGVHYSGEYKGQVTYFDMVGECLDAVRTGEADYCYGNAYSVQYYVSDPDYRNLIVVPQYDWEMNCCFGILDSGNERLNSILNKTIQDFHSHNLLQSCLYENAYRQESVTLRSYLVANPVEAVLLCLLFLLMTGLIVLTLLWRKDKKGQRIRRLENERYEQLSEISNELLFEYDARTDVMKLSEKCAEYLGLPRRLEQVSVNGATASFFTEWIRNRKEENGELRLPLAGGEIHWMRITVKAVKDTEGEDIYLVGKLTDIQEEREEKEKLQVKAERDSLTGVYNMATFREKVLAMYERLEDKDYAFYVIDIDYFKQVNDTFGHYVGDIVLEKLGSILFKVFSGKDDETGRLGGDEFVAQTIYRGDPEEIGKKCALLNETVRRIDFEGRTEPVTVSIGVALVKAGQDFEAAYRLADEALYTVKRDGRDSFCILTAPDSIHTQDSIREVATDEEE